MDLTKPPLILALILALLTTVAGCGGSGGGATSSPVASGSTAVTATQPDQGSKAPTTLREAGIQRAKSGDAVLTDPDPLPNQGTSAVAPGVPTIKHGDNSIQTYGVEAQSTERIAAARLVKSFLAAEAAGKWGEACGHVRSLIRRRLEMVARQSPGGQLEGCAGSLAALISRVPRAQRERSAQIQVLSFRAMGPQAFVVYRDGAGKAYNMPLRREDGQWLISALVGIELML